MALMTTINADGQVVLRTALFRDMATANLCADSVRADGRFADVRIRESEKAQSLAWYVEFRPAAETDREKLAREVEDQQQRRAAQEGALYLYWQGGTGRFDYCFNPLSGETYEVSGRSCTCPQWQHRLQKVGMACKHMIERRARQMRGTLYRGTIAA